MAKEIIEKVLGTRRTIALLQAAATIAAAQTREYPKDLVGEIVTETRRIQVDWVVDRAEELLAEIERRMV